METYHLDTRRAFFLLHVMFLLYGLNDAASISHSIESLDGGNTRYSRSLSSTAKHLGITEISQLLSQSCTKEGIISQLPVGVTRSRFEVRKIGDHPENSTRIRKVPFQGSGHPSVFQIKFRTAGFLAIMSDNSLATTANKSSVRTYFRHRQCDMICDGKSYPVIQIESVIRENGDFSSRNLWLVIDKGHLKVAEGPSHQIGDLGLCPKMGFGERSSHFVYM